MDEQVEQEVILRCQAGEMTALGELFREHHEAVFRTAYGIVRSQELAEDVTQQVFIELFDSIKRYDPERGRFAPWLYRIVVNESLDELKRAKRRKGRDVPIGDACDLASAGASPEDEAEEAELRAAILKRIWALGPKHRAVVVLRYYRGFSEAEMAVVLGCRRGTVKSRLYNALRELRDFLNPEDPHAAPKPAPPKPPRPGGQDSIVVCAPSRSKVQLC